MPNEALTPEEQAMDDAQFSGTGFLMILPDGTTRCLRPWEVTLILERKEDSDAPSS